MKHSIRAILFAAAMSLPFASNAAAVTVLNGPCYEIGTIDSIDQAKRQIVISGNTYRFVSFKVAVYNDKQAIDPSRLTKGTAVRYALDVEHGGRGTVSQIWVLPPVR